MPHHGFMRPQSASGSGAGAAQTFCTAGGPAFAALVVGAFGEWSDDLESFRTGIGTGNGGGTRSDSDDDSNPDEWAEGTYHLRRETRFGIGA
ncbi:hypothetical protein T492DRAFT_862753 [Pavlovales sp. CCMP2436]|nr:hypothetical protein T492DRAFT_862753 [Pavlovales sp. CCMP2436]